ADARTLAQVAALHRLTDAMVSARNQAGLNAIEHLEQLSRPERQSKTDEQLKVAREGFADRLKLEKPRHAGRLAQWLAIERLSLATQSNRDVPAIARDSFDALQTLDALPTLAVSRPTDSSDGDDATRRLDIALRGRHLAILSYLATRSGVDAALVDRLLK